MLLSKLKNLYKENISYGEKTELKKNVIIFLIILDIFIVFILSQGIYFQTKIINNPYLTNPHKCLQMNYNYDEIRKNQFDKLYFSKITNNKSKSYKEYDSNKYTSEKCTLLIDSYDSMSQIKEIKEFKELKATLKNRESNFKSLSTIYDTSLLEKIALDKNSYKKEEVRYYNLSKEIEELKQKKNYLETFIKEREEVKLFKQTYLKFYEDIKEEDSILKKNYGLKKDLISILFLLPIVIISFSFLKKYRRKQIYIKYLLSKNIFYIALIPFIAFCLSIVNNFIPKVLLSKLLNFFIEFKMPFIGYYILLFLGVFILSMIIIKLQNKKEKKVQFKISFIDSYHKSICPTCSIRVNYIYMNNCPGCGEILKEKCKVCHKESIKGFDYCMNCGTKSTDKVKE